MRKLAAKMKMTAPDLTRDHMIRAVWEGVALTTRWNYDSSRIRLLNSSSSSGRTGK